MFVYVLCTKCVIPVFSGEVVYVHPNCDNKIITSEFGPYYFFQDIRTIVFGSNPIIVSLCTQFQV